MKLTDLLNNPPVQPYDTTPTSGSTNPVTSQGIKTYVDDSILPLNNFTSSYSTGSFTGSFTGSLFGTSSFASTSSYLTPLNQDIYVTGSLNVSGSIDVTDTVQAILLSGSLRTDKISFTQQGPFTGVQGDLGYSFDDGRFTFFIENDVPIELGQTLYARVRNADSVILTKGTIVDFTSDTVGQTPRVKRAIATSGADCSCFVGAVLQDIEVNGFGAIMLNGVARGLNLTSYNTDDQLYLSSTVSGSATTTIPTPPVKAIRIGKVLNASSSPTQGVLYVRPENRTVYFDLDNFKQTYNTGSFTGSFTGSLFGTASFSQTSSLAQTASFLNTLNQDLTFNGNLTLNGTASITTLVVNETQYSSGSNQLGDGVEDTQTFFGTVVIPTGSLTVTGSISSTSLTGSEDRIVVTDPSGTLQATAQTIIQAYLDPNGPQVGLLNNVANWDIYGIYQGPQITDTFQGQKHYNTNYFFEAIDDNVWIRLIRG
jgi:hypothetical protein